jgi:hypothetical protein
VDFYALGVIAYEFMLGRVMIVRVIISGPTLDVLGRRSATRSSPSKCKSRGTRFPKVGAWKQPIASIGYSIDDYDKLIQRKANNRLGFTGTHEIKLHPWFKQFPWSKLAKCELKSPYIPNVKSVA